MMKVRNYGRSAMWTAVLLMAVAAVLPAQRNKEKDDPNIRNIEGVVLDATDNPVPRAVVQLKDMRTLQVRSFITQPQGEYRFTGLRKDTDYELKATFQDQSSDTKRLSVFDNRKTATINLKLEKK
jgi:hypothetical protein